MTFRIGFGIAVFSISSLLSQNALADISLRSSSYTENIVANTSQCDLAVASVENQLTSGRSLQIEMSEKVSGDELFGKPPAERPERHSFGMSGDAVSSVMGSPVFLNSLATEIINDCDTVSAVSFNLWQSDYIEVFGLKDGQNVERFTCSLEGYDPYDPETHKGRKPSWGDNCS